MSFPRVLHQIWFGPKPRPAHLMDPWEAWAKGAGFAYSLHTNLDGWGAAQPLIDRIDEPAGKSDVMRYVFLSEAGGIYIDADTELLRGLMDDGDHFLSHRCWAGYESEIKRPGLLANGQLGSLPGEPLWDHMLKMIPRRDLAGPAWKATGPDLLTEVAQIHPELYRYPARTWNPVHFDGKTPAPGDAPIYGRHLWGSHGKVYAPEPEDARPWIAFPDGNVSRPAPPRALPAVPIPSGTFMTRRPGSMG